MWPVSAERPLERRPGIKGAVAYPAKRLLRPFLRWYVEPLAAEQRAFNDATLKLIDDLYEAGDLGVAQGEAAQRTMSELDERLRRVERRGTSGAPVPVTRWRATAAAAARLFRVEARRRGRRGRCS
jgi:hypothetical protein